MIADKDRNDHIRLHRFEVSQPYHPDRQSWPEISQFNYRGGEHDLVLFLNEPTQQEVQAARTGKAEFALLVQDGVIMLCHRFEGGLPWSDSAFCYWLVPPAERCSPPVLSGDQRALMFVTLVDASTGILRAQRVVSLSSEFTAALHEAIRQQARTTYRGKVEHEKRVGSILRRYPTTDALVAVATVHCTGRSSAPEEEGGK